MPELPEVETIVRDLNKQTKNLRIKKFEIVNKLPGRVHSPVNLPENLFKRKIIGKKIKKVSRRAKIILFDLHDSYLLIHLKMTGQLVYKRSAAGVSKVIAGGHPIIGVDLKLPNKFTRAIFTFNNKANLFFNDVRRFGWLKLLERGEWQNQLKSMGTEPLSRDFTLNRFGEILSRKGGATIKQALMDQKYLAGIGNIYADESLFLAGVKPSRRVKFLKKEEIKRVHQAVIRVLKKAIKYRGTSFSDYLDPAGNRGNFIKYLKVYGRKDEKCKRCGSLIKKIKLGGRGAHWCGKCQK